MKGSEKPGKTPGFLILTREILIYLLPLLAGCRNVWTGSFFNG